MGILGNEVYVASEIDNNEEEQEQEDVVDDIGFNGNDHGCDGISSNHNAPYSSLT